MTLSKEVYLFQYRIFNITLILTYLLMALIIVGGFDSAEKYLSDIQYYLKIYVCLFLIYRFNPLRKVQECTYFDRRVAFSSGLFLLFATLINEVLLVYIKEIRSYLRKHF